MKLVLKRPEMMSPMREVEMLQRVQSDFVTKLHRWTETKTHFALELETMWGGDLHDYVYDKRYLYRPSECNDYFRQIVLAVRYIHNRGIIHRDIKLENVLLDRRGKVKLADFAFAISFRPIEYGLDEKIVSGKFYRTIGTIPYLSPEMILKKGYDYSTDIWSAGVMLYEMITGYLPFIAEDNDETMDAICHFEYTPPLASKKIRQLVAGILVKDPAKRWTANEILSHL